MRGCSRFTRWWPRSELRRAPRFAGNSGLLLYRMSDALCAECEHPPGRLNRRRARRHSVPRDHETGSLSRAPVAVSVLFDESARTVRRVDLMPPSCPLPRWTRSNSLSRTARKPPDLRGFREMEPTGIEPATSCLQSLHRGVSLCSAVRHSQCFRALCRWACVTVGRCLPQALVPCFDPGRREANTLNEACMHGDSGYPRDRRLGRKLDARGPASWLSPTNAPPGRAREQLAPRTTAHRRWSGGSETDAIASQRRAFPACGSRREHDQRGCSTPETDTATGLPLRAESGTTAASAAWATEQHFRSLRSMRLTTRRITFALG